MSLIKFGKSKIKEIGKLFKKEGTIQRQVIIRDGFYICSKCGAKICKVREIIPLVCKGCKTLFTTL